MEEKETSMSSPLGGINISVDPLLEMTRNPVGTSLGTDEQNFVCAPLELVTKFLLIHHCKKRKHPFAHRWGVDEQASISIVWEGCTSIRWRTVGLEINKYLLAHRWEE